MSQSWDNTQLPEKFTQEFTAHYAGYMPRAAAKMLAALLVSSEAEMSSRDLVEGLGISPASVSNSGRFLLNQRLVERSVSPETRRDHYRIRDDVWLRMYRENGRITEEVLRILDAALEHGSDWNPRALERLREMRTFYAFLAQEMPKLAERYEEWRVANGPDHYHGPRTESEGMA